MTKIHPAGRVTAPARPVFFGLGLALPLLLASCGVLGPSPSPQPTPEPGGAGSGSGGNTGRLWQDEVIYFVLTDRFSNGDTANDNGADRNAADHADRQNPLGWHGGDWKGIQQKIESGYFKKLGATALWISPVVMQVPSISVNDGPNKGQTFAGYHGYWADDFFKTDPHFGGQADLKALVSSAHANGLKVIQDVVVNHAGYGTGLGTTHPDWFHTPADCAATSNTDQDCPLAGLPDFNQNVPAVTAYLNDFVSYWRRNVGIDGLRIDTMKHVPDSYWQQFFEAGGAGDPAQLWSVGEVFNGDPAVLARYIDVLGSPSVFDFALYFSLKDNLSSDAGSLDALAGVFAKDGAYRDASKLTTFIDNHDVPRFVSEVQARGGNTTEAAQRLDLALSLMYAARGTPSIYQGTEIAQAGKGDPYNFPLGQGNREDMDFARVATSPTAARITVLAAARAGSPALRRGLQQELWRPAGGAPIYAFRRVLSGHKPVVVVMNNGPADLDLADLPAGGIPLLGTFGAGPLSELTGKSSTLALQGGKLVGTVPARSLLMVSGGAGSGAGTTVNPALPEVGSLSAQPGDGAVKLSWAVPASPAMTTSPDVSGYRIYQSALGSQERLLNFAPLASGTTSFVVTGLSNAQAYGFRVVCVDVQGRESVGTQVQATPDARYVAKVSFTLDARTQGNGQLELRRFDTGQQVIYPMTQTARGIWKTDIELPLFREVKFKFGNSAAGARNSGYEAPGQSDRSLNVVNGATYSATYNFISRAVPGGVIEGVVTGAGTPLAGASVEGNDPQFDSAVTFTDGSFTLLADGGQSLRASAGGYLSSAAQTVTAPATGVRFDLARDLRTRYAIDGNLSDWTAPKVSLSSPGAGVFGADNNWLTLQADSDDQYLYLAYTYRVSGNSALLYLDTRAGGATRADGFDAWRRAADLTGAEYFLAGYENQSIELRRIDSDTATTNLGTASFVHAQTGTLPAQTAELAIPWTQLGFSGKPTTPITLYGGVFGGDGYGAGDIVPDAGSTPPGQNTTAPEAQQRRATFTQGLTFTP